MQWCEYYVSPAPPFSSPRRRSNALSEDRARPHGTETNTEPTGLSCAACKALSEASLKHPARCTLEGAAGPANPVAGEHSTLYEFPQASAITSRNRSHRNIQLSITLLTSIGPFYERKCVLPSRVHGQWPSIKAKEAYNR